MPRTMSSTIASAPSRSKRAYGAKSRAPISLVCGADGCTCATACRRKPRARSTPSSAKPRPRTTTLPCSTFLSAQILADDQTSIRAHILRGMSLRRTGHATEADFQREIAKVLTESIVGKGDGRGFDSAWTVYRVREEPEVLKALGCVVESQWVASHGGRRFDVLLTRKTDSGEAMELYFDVSEMFAEDVRRPGAN